MARIILFILCMMMCFGNVDAGIGVGGAYVPAAAVDYSDIIFYHDCDAKDDANKSGGSGTVSYDAGITVNSTDKVVGIACWDGNGAAWNSASFATSGNTDFSSGRIGFYFRYAATVYGPIVRTNDGDMYFQYRTAEPTGWRAQYLGTNSYDFTSFTADTWYFVEFKFDGTTMYTYVNGSLEATTTGSGAVDETTLQFFSAEGDTIDFMIDQVIISNDKDRDLNAIKSVTDFS